LKPSQINLIIVKKIEASLKFEPSAAAYRI